jgi:hypothetical protein
MLEEPAEIIEEKITETNLLPSIEQSEANAISKQRPR